MTTHDDIDISFPLMRQERFANLSQSSTQYGVCQIGGSLLYAIKAIELRVVAMPQPFALREDVPYPMALLLTVLDFAQCYIVGVCLRLNETVEIERSGLYRREKISIRQTKWSNFYTR
jgi:hypothetical protein